MQLQALYASTPPLSPETGGPGALGGGANVAAPPAILGAPSAQQQPASTPTTQQLHDAVGQANTSLQAIASSLEFQIDPDTKQVIVRLVDTSDNKVLRQVPSVQVLAIAKAIDTMQGLLIKQVA